jgi:hypothetical protein
MSCVSVFVLCSTLCLGVPPDHTGTNGAGTDRTWTAFEGNQSTSIQAKFIAVRKGVVMLHRTVDVQVAMPVSPYKPNHIRRETVKQDVPIQVPLMMLSAGDRRWIEDRNPIETCLTEKSKKGEVGTLSPKDGAYFVTQIDTDQNKALVQYVRKGEVVWTFSLQSKLVAHLKPMTQYETISHSLIPGFENMSQNSKERYGVDFKLSEKYSKSRKEAEDVDLIEDYR